MEEWANPTDPGASGGLDLHLETTGAGGVRAGLEAALRDAVRQGRLTAGTRLPSSRALAADLGVARNTVADAYGQLVAEGWLTARQGSGTRVAERRARPAPARPAEVRPSSGSAAGAGLVPGLLASPLPYDLRPGTPDVSAFPRAAWLAATRQALLRAPHEALGYGDPRGQAVLRRALADYLARVRGVRTDPELVVVCAGFMQAVGLLGRALAAGGGRRIAVEAVGFSDTPAALRASGLAADPLPVDADGARVDLLGNADAVLLTPSHQFPTGVVLSPERRTAVIGWARESGGVVVEDDYDGEFRYDRHAVGALQGLDPASVVYAGTASKSLAPGLRLAWLALPERLLDAVTLQKRLADHHSPAIEQLALAELISSGAYDRHVRRMRLHYRRRRDRLVAALAERAPAVRVSGIAAGLHAVVELPPGSLGEPQLLARAAASGLALAGSDHYGDLSRPGAPALVIGFGGPPEHAFTGALDRLCAVLAEATRTA